MSKLLKVDFSISATEAAINLEGETVTWTTEAEHPFSATNGNFALLAALPTAFTQGRPLHIGGPVDRALMRNAVLLSQYWAQWVPDMYSPIRITADSLIDNLARKGGRTICLSGGVDSTFALLSSLNEPSTQHEIGLGVFVQGFDYSLSDDDGYQLTLAAVRRVAEPRGIPVTSLKTNWRNVACGRGPGKAEWEHVHTPALGAILHLYGGDYAGGIIGSDYTFREDHIVAPRSSNGVTNRLLASQDYPIEPVGEHAPRIEKISSIAAWGELPNVNVCWAGPRTGKNCARCEKCVRTMLMCEASGIDPTSAFGRRPVPSDLSSISLHSAGKIAFMRQTLGPGSRLSPELKQAVERAIARNRVRNLLKPHYRKIIQHNEPGLPF